MPAAEASPEQLVQMMVGREVSLSGYPAAAEKGAEILRVEHLCTERTQFSAGLQDISFSLHAGEVLGIAAISPVKLVSFAPEMTGGTAFAAACRDHGIVPSCGHTGATFAQFLPAYDAGLRHLTHFCNQMTKLHHREIGIVGAGFLLDDLNTEVICDRIHLCDDMLRLVFWKRDLAHVQMITDSLRCSHCPDGYAFEMGGLKVVLKGGEARLVEGGNLAGSTLWMNRGLRNLVEVTGLPLKDLIRVTSWNQAIELGLGSSLGKVEKGYYYHPFSTTLTRGVMVALQFLVLPV